MDQRERRMLVAWHGGLLSYTMNDNPMVVLVDGKDADDDGEGTPTRRSKAKLFDNCEMRELVNMSRLPPLSPRQLAKIITGKPSLLKSRRACAVL
jgi:hypothetical protein